MAGDRSHCLTPISAARHARAMQLGLASPEDELLVDVRRRVLAARSRDAAQQQQEATTGGCGTVNGGAAGIRLTQVPRSDARALAARQRSSDAVPDGDPDGSDSEPSDEDSSADEGGSGGCRADSDGKSSSDESSECSDGSDDSYSPEQSGRRRRANGEGASDGRISSAVSQPHRARQQPTSSGARAAPRLEDDARSAWWRTGRKEERKRGAHDQPSVRALDQKRRRRDDDGDGAPANGDGAPANGDDDAARQPSMRDRGLRPDRSKRRQPSAALEAEEAEAPMPPPLLSAAAAVGAIWTACHEQRRPSWSAAALPTASRAMSGTRGGAPDAPSVHHLTPAADEGAAATRHDVAAAPRARAPPPAAGALPLPQSVRSGVAPVPTAHAGGAASVRADGGSGGVAVRIHRRPLHDAVPASASAAARELTTGGRTANGTATAATALVAGAPPVGDVAPAAIAASTAAAPPTTSVPLTAKLPPTANLPPTASSVPPIRAVRSTTPQPVMPASAPSDGRRSCPSESARSGESGPAHQTPPPSAFDAHAAAVLARRAQLAQLSSSRTAASVALATLPHLNAMRRSRLTPREQLAAMRGPLIGAGAAQPAASTDGGDDLNALTRRHTWTLVARWESGPPAGGRVGSGARQQMAATRAPGHEPTKRAAA